MTDCPICGEKAISSCRCPRGDSTCENGHEWHRCTIHNSIVIGPSDHSLDTFTCTCKKEKFKEDKKLECETCKVGDSHFRKSIATHVSEMVTKEMREHACADAKDHDLEFQIFRLLSGYDEALEEISRLQGLLGEAREEMDSIIVNGPAWLKRKALKARIDAELSPEGNSKGGEDESNA
jgi:hypothetical protein